MLLMGRRHRLANLLHTNHAPRVSNKTKKPRNTPGYTLFESLVALAILITIIVPLTTFFYRKADSARLMRSITAICMLEQEAALTLAFPRDAAPVKRRTINGAEWIVRTEESGADPIVYKMTAAIHGRVVDSVVFYGRSGNAAHQ
jgi:hypothetical protein